MAGNVAAGDRAARRPHPRRRRRRARSGPRRRRARAGRPHGGPRADRRAQPPAATGRVLDQVQLFGCRSIAEIVARVAARCATRRPARGCSGAAGTRACSPSAGTRRATTSIRSRPTTPVCSSASGTGSSQLRRARRVPASTARRPTRRRRPLRRRLRARRRGQPTGPLPRPREGARLGARPAADRGRRGDGDRDGVPRPTTGVGIVRCASPASRPSRAPRVRPGTPRGRADGSHRPDDGRLGLGTTSTRTRASTSGSRHAGVATGLGDDCCGSAASSSSSTAASATAPRASSSRTLAAPGSRGEWVVDPGAPARPRPRRARPRLAMDCHTCGDEAQEAVVRAYAAAQEASPRPHLRHRVHHAYFPTPVALELMARHRIARGRLEPVPARAGRELRA